MPLPRTVGSNRMKSMPYSMLLISREHATLQSTLSVGRSVGRSVGWSVVSRFGSKAFVLHPADEGETLAKEEQETD